MYKGEHFEPILFFFYFFLGGGGGGKNHKFLEFSESLSQTSKIQQFGYEYISAAHCTREKRQMRKSEKRQGSNQSQLQF